jgi:hypothetical protein
VVYRGGNLGRSRDESAGEKPVFMYQGNFQMPMDYTNGDID